MNDRLQELRRAIAANDRLIVGAVNERLRLVGELWQLKEELSVDRLDPERERALLAELEQANRGPLSREGLDRMIRELLDLTKRELGQ